MVNICEVLIVLTRQQKYVYSMALLRHHKTCVVTNISAVLWVFLQHHQHLCHIMGLSATSPTSLSYYGSFCDITNISVILLSIFFLSRSMALSATSQTSLRHHKCLCRIASLCTTPETSMCYPEWDVPLQEFKYLACTRMPPHSEHSFPAPSSKLCQI